MLNLGALAFLNPWLLAALGLLPILWWLLRVTPPAPRVIAFPPLRLLLGLIPREETPAHTPLWLLLLRLLTAGLIIVALAEPVINPRPPLQGQGPVILVLDDGWAAAPDWTRRMATVTDYVNQAERSQRPVMLLTTAAPADGGPVQVGKLMPAGQALAAVAALKPRPWPVDRRAVVKALQDFKPAAPADIVWVSDGIDDEFAYTLAERLQWFGALTVVGAPIAELPKALLPPVAAGEGLKISALRPGGAGEVNLWVRAATDQGQHLAREKLTIAADAKRGETVIALPTEMRNRVARLEIEGENSAAAVTLLDERWRRRPVGLVSGKALEARQPLLSDLYYLQRALTPFTEVREGSIAELLRRELAVLILTDIGQVVGPERAALDRWLDQGGVLVRFAGPRLAESSDSLLPVRLRRGTRQLGGAMSWSQPAALAPFAEAGPFFGLPLPDDVTIDRQVLAEPELALAGKTWAKLADETPLVTGEARGRGWLALFHTTANTDWSNLALSGLFVEMLRRIVDLSQGVGASDGSEPLAPHSLLDGFGRLAPPQSPASAIVASELAKVKPGPRHPPGFYGNDAARRALNLAANWTELMPIARWPAGTMTRPLGDQRELPLLGWLLTLAMGLVLADLVIAFVLRGLFERRPAGAATAGALVAGAIIATAALAQAQSPPAVPTLRPDLQMQLPAPNNLGRRPLSRSDDFALAGALELRLAYVRTGMLDIDEMSRAGLVGLTDALFRRTSVEASDPMGIDLERDEVVFFPFLYWPIVPEQPDLTDAAVARVDSFMKTGGLILFDTRDQDLGGLAANRQGPGAQRLRKLLARLDLPPLVPVPPDHVLTKAFYLTQEFPGRYTGGQVWVERHPGDTNDGVSALVIGAHDWAAAWAIDSDGRPLAAIAPGGGRQREYAFRFGINLVMYSLTGNYKADQVHIPALLERLGQ